MSESRSILIPSGHTISYLDQGQGRPVVLLHAFPLCKEMWGPQIEALSGKFRMVAPDLPGFGDSGGFEDDASVEAMAQTVAELLAALKLPRAVIGGLSMGGYVSLAFARLFPQLLSGLILADTKAAPDDEAGKEKRNEMIAFAHACGSRAVAEKMLPNLLAETSRTADPALARQVVAWGEAQSVSGLVNGLRALRDRPDSSPILPSISVPVLAIGGAADAITTPDIMRQMAAAIPAAKHALIPRAGHLSNLENPAAFNQALDEFLQELKP